LPISNEKDAQEWIANNGKDTLITSFNWAELSQAVDREYYVPEMYKKIESTDPEGLKRKNMLDSPLSQQFNDQILQSGEEDHFAKYREIRATHLKGMMDQAGVDAGTLAEIIRNRKSSIEDNFDPNNPKKTRLEGVESKNY